MATEILPAARQRPRVPPLEPGDHLTRAEFEDWLRRPREQGGAGLPAGQARSSSLAMRFVVDGLALRAAREPDLDRTEVRVALEELLRTLLKPGD